MASPIGVRVVDEDVVPTLILASYAACATTLFAPIVHSGAVWPVVVLFAASCAVFWYHPAPVLERLKGMSCAVLITLLLRLAFTDSAHIADKWHVGWGRLLAVAGVPGWVSSGVFVVHGVDGAVAFRPSVYSCSTWLFVSLIAVSAPILGTRGYRGASSLLGLSLCWFTVALLRYQGIAAWLADQPDILVSRSSSDLIAFWNPTVNAVLVVLVTPCVASAVTWDVWQRRCTKHGGK